MRYGQHIFKKALKQYPLLCLILSSCSTEPPKAPSHVSEDSAANATADIQKIPSTDITSLPLANSISISWSEQKDISSYALRWSEVPNFKDQYELIENIKSPYKHRDISQGKKIYYVLVGLDKDGKVISASEEFSASAINFTAPALQASARFTFNSLQWNTVEGANTYDLYWNTTGSDKKDASRLIANVTSPYEHRGIVAEGPNFYYFIVAKNNESLLEVRSPVVNAKLEVLGTPMVTITPYFNEIKLSWDAINGADKYQIFLSTQSNVDTSGNPEVDNITGTTYTIGNKAEGTIYHFKVRAVSSSEGVFATSISLFAKTLTVPAFSNKPPFTHTGITLFISTATNSPNTSTLYQFKWAYKVNNIVISSGVIPQPPQTSATVVHSGLMDTTKYEYKLVVKSADGFREKESAALEFSTVSPPPP